MDHKAFRLEIKNVSQDGTFEGYASVFGVVDEYGEVVERGAFKRTLDHWGSSGRPIPILWQHRPDQPIGKTLEVREDEHGLYVKGQLILDVERAREAYALLREGVLSGLSIGYTVIKDAWDDGVRRLRELRLYEYSVVTWPANPDARVVGVKGVAPADVSRELAPEDAPWERPTLGDFTDASWDELEDDEKRRIAGHYAWAPRRIPERFLDLKLPHHRPSDGAVVWAGVRAAMAALLGARGGVDIPEADRRKVYDHLARHYRQFDREPPEFRSYTELELLELYPDIADPHHGIREAIKQLTSLLQGRPDPVMSDHSGATGPEAVMELAREIRELAHKGE